MSLKQIFSTSFVRTALLASLAMPQAFAQDASRVLVHLNLRFAADLVQQQSQFFLELENIESIDRQTICRQLGNIETPYNVLVDTFSGLGHTIQNQSLRAALHEVAFLPAVWSLGVSFEGMINNNCRGLANEHPMVPMSNTEIRAVIEQLLNLTDALIETLPAR